MPFGKNGLPEIDEKELGKVKDLGSGTYGSVIAGSFKKSNTPQGAKYCVVYAHKQMGDGYNTRDKNTDVPMKYVIPEIMEMAVMFDSNHKNVMRGVSAYLLKEDVPGTDVDVLNLTITMDLASGVLDLGKKSHRTWDMVSQVMLGLNHLHINGIAHYDLKPKNILIFKDESAGGRLVPKITDFGLSNAYQHVNSTFKGRVYRGTNGWLPYEMIGNDPKSGIYNNIEIGRKSDLFTLGLIIVQLLGHGTRKKIENVVYNKDRTQSKKDVIRIIKQSKIYSIPISTKIANFVFDNFLGTSIHARVELKECLKSKEFEELCTLTKSEIVFPLDKETHFTCLVPYRSDNIRTNKFRQDIMRRIHNNKFTTLVKIYAIDLYDRVIRSNAVEINDLPTHIKYMKTCLMICNSIFEITGQSNTKINVERYLNIINAVNGTLYRALSSFLTTSNDWEYILYLFETIKKSPLDDIINGGCSDYNPGGMSVVHSNGLRNVKSVNETTVSFQFNKGMVPYGANSSKLYWQTVGEDCISSNDDYTSTHNDKNAKGIAIALNSNHNNIIKSVSTYFLNNDVDEMCPTMAIEAPLGFLDKNNRKYQTWDICAQIILGATYLNENGIYHTELTCDSIVVYRMNGKYVPRITNLDKTEFVSDETDIDRTNTEDCGHLILDLLGKNYNPTKLIGNDEGYNHKYIAKVMLANGCTYNGNVMYKISKFLVKYLLTKPSEPLWILIRTPLFRKLITLTKSRVVVPTKKGSLIKSNLPSLMSKNYPYPHPSDIARSNVDTKTLIYAIDLYNRCMYFNYHDYITFESENNLFNECIAVMALLFENRGNDSDISSFTISKARFNKIVADVDGLLFREIPLAEIKRIKKLIEK